MVGYFVLFAYNHFNINDEITLYSRTSSNRRRPTRRCCDTTNTPHTTDFPYIKSLPLTGHTPQTRTQKIQQSDNASVFHQQKGSRVENETWGYIE
jgi:hypothetical protein